MTFTLTLFASQQDGTGAIVSTSVTIPPDAMQGMKPTNAHALDVVLECLKEKGFDVE